MSLFLWMVVGAVVGWLFGNVMKDSGYGQMPEIVMGVVAAVVGGIATGLLFGMNTASGFNVETLAVAVGAAALAIGVSRVYKHSRANG